MNNKRNCFREIIDYAIPYDCVNYKNSNCHNGKCSLRLFKISYNNKMIRINSKYKLKDFYEVKICVYCNYSPDLKTFVFFNREILNALNMAPCSVLGVSNGKKYEIDDFFTAYFNPKIIYNKKGELYEK